MAKPIPLTAMLFILSPPTSARAQPSLDVPLTIRDVSGVVRASEPVSTGVPFPSGLLADAMGLAVLDPNGVAVPAQFRVLERWREHGNDDSVKWLLVTFLADAPAGGSSTYRLTRGTNPAPVSPVYVSESSTAFAVGSQSFMKDFSGPFELVLTESDGVTVHRANDLPGIAWTVEENGPVRVVLKAESPTVAGQFGFIAWIRAYAGLDRWDVTVVLKNTPKVGRGPFYFDDFSVEWRRAGSNFTLGGDAGSSLSGTVTDNEHVVLYQDSSGTDRWSLLNEQSATPEQDGIGAYVLNWDKTTWTNGIPDFRGYKISSGAAELGNGDHALGWVSLGSSGVLVRDFWQQYPKAVEVTKDLITVRLWPKYWNGHGGSHWLDDLQRKAYDLSFVARSVTEDDAVAFNHPLVIHCGLDWYRSTGALGYLSDNLSEQVPDPSNLGRWEYNWLMWGGDSLDRIRRRYHEHPMIRFIHSGDPFHAYRTLIASRHSSGVTPLWLDTYTYPQDRGVLRPSTYGTPARDKGSYTAGTDHHGFMPWNQQHWTAQEVFDAWRLFGDPLALDAARKMGVYTQFWVDHRQTNGIGESRLDALPQKILAEAFRVTGDSSFLASVHSYLDIVWGTVDKSRGYYVPNRSLFPPLGADKSFMLAFVAEGLEQTFSLTGDERAADTITGLTDYVIDEAYVDPCYAVIYEAPIDPDLRDQELQTAQDSAKAACTRGSGWQEWRLMSLVTLSYQHTGAAKYKTVFDDLLAAAQNEGGAFHVWNDEMDHVVERPRADVTPPAAIADLDIAVTGAEVRLSWTAPAEASWYQVKYSDKPMVESIAWPEQESTHSNWWAAENVDGEPFPGSSGSLESFTLVGIPPGVYWFAVRSFDSSSNRSELSNLAQAVVGDYFAITTTSLGDGQVGLPYASTLQAAGGAAPYHWAVVAGALPFGLTLDDSGNIAGVPTVAVDVTFTARALDSGSPSRSHSRELSLLIRPTDIPTHDGADPGDTDATAASVGGDTGIEEDHGLLLENPRGLAGSCACRENGSLPGSLALVVAVGCRLRRRRRHGNRRTDE